MKYYNYEYEIIMQLHKHYGLSIQRAEYIFGIMKEAIFQSFTYMGDHPENYAQECVVIPRKHVPLDYKLELRDEELRKQIFGKE